MGWSIDGGGVCEGLKETLEFNGDERTQSLQGLSPLQPLANNGASGFFDPSPIPSLRGSAIRGRRGWQCTNTLYFTTIKSKVRVVCDWASAGDWRVWWGSKGSFARPACASASDTEVVDGTADPP